MINPLGPLVRHRYVPLMLLGINGAIALTGAAAPKLWLLALLLAAIAVFGSAMPPDKEI